MATKSDKPSDRTSWKWSSEELQFLVDNASLSGDEMAEAFRAKYPKFTGSRQAILGRRYSVLNRPSDPQARVRAIESKIAATRTKLAELEQALTDARAAVEPVDWTKATMAALREAVKAAGVTPAGRKKADFVAALEQVA